MISRSTSGLDGFAFLCGLLHDVGIAACILALSGPLKALAPHGFIYTWPCINEIHESRSELLAKIWGLPPDVALVLRLHHEPRVDERVHPLAAAVRLADIYADLHGFGFMSESEPAKLQETAEQLGIIGCAGALE